MHRIAWPLISTFLLWGCSSSTITAFRDPVYETKQFTSLVVFAQGMALDAAVEVERQICVKIAPTPCKSGKSVLPPTRQYTVDEVEKHLQASGADAVLIIALFADQADTGYASTMNFYLNVAYWNSTAYGYSPSRPVSHNSRVAFGQLGLFDRPTGNTAWRGEIKVTGQGAANITDDAFINSATSEIVRKLKEDRLVN